MPDVDGLIAIAMREPQWKEIREVNPSWYAPPSGGHSQARRKESSKFVKKTVNFY